MNRRIVVTMCAVLALGCSEDPGNSAGPDGWETEAETPTPEPETDQEDPEDPVTDPPDEDPKEAEFQTGVEVETTTGAVRGEEDGDLRVFKGIPFAESTAGDNRLRAPQPVQPWDDVLDATEFGDVCPQIAPTVGDEGEDCLNLNVWAHTDGREDRPVMVWIYGGGFVLGETALPTYDGADLAEDGDVVLITINYRLGVLGNMALPELQDEDPLGAAGNMGLLDQVEALRWIKANARAFGGDPDNITVFGESAGAMSTCALIGTPLADDLFDKAILQSGSCALYSPLDEEFLGRPGALDFGEQVAGDLGCAGADDRLACLRELPVGDFVNALNSDLQGGLIKSQIAIGPTIDGVVLPKTPYARIEAGEAPERPLIVGSNGAEGTLFTSSDVILSREAFRDEVEAIFGDVQLAQDVVDLYSRLQFPISKDAYNAFVGELLFNCNSYHVAQLMGDKAYTYYLMVGPPQTMTPYGPLHGADIFYVFGNFLASGIAPTLASLELSSAMQQAWGSFARTGVPSWEGGWPSMGGASSEFLQIDLFPSVEDEFRRGRCDALQDLGVLP